MLVVLAGVALSVATQPVDLEPLLCDAEHPCLDGYACVAGRCYDPLDASVADGGPDGGPSDGGPSDGGPSDGGPSDGGM